MIAARPEEEHLPGALAPPSILRSRTEIN